MCTTQRFPFKPFINTVSLQQEFLRREVKPRTKEELVDGIQAFWMTVDIPKCRKYIGHLRKVIPKIVEVGGDATGY